MRSPDGTASVAHAHVLGFFRRISKLLYAGILPVFVFDGGVPALKQRTTAARRQRREGAGKRVEDTHRRLMGAKLKQYALEQLDEAEAPEAERRKTQGVQPVPPEHDDFQLPDIDVAALLEAESPQESEGELDLSDVDIESETFQSLPLELQQELLYELRIKSRQPSWDRVQEIIAKAPSALDFSKLQILNLVRRNTIWMKLDQLQQSQPSKDGEAMVQKRVAAMADKEYILIKHQSKPTWTLQQTQGEPLADEPAARESHGFKTNPTTVTVPEEDLLLDSVADVVSLPSTSLRDAMYRQWSDILPGDLVARDADLGLFLREVVYELPLSALLEMRRSLEKRHGKHRAGDEDDSTRFRLEIVNDVIDALYEGGMEAVEVEDVDQKATVGTETAQGLAINGEASNDISEPELTRSRRHSKPKVIALSESDEDEWPPMLTAAVTSGITFQPELEDRADQAMEKETGLMSEKSEDIMSIAALPQTDTGMSQVVIEVIDEIPMELQHSYSVSDDDDFAEGALSSHRNSFSVPVSPPRSDQPLATKTDAEVISFIEAVQSTSLAVVQSDLNDKVASLQEKRRKERTTMSAVSSDMIRDVQDLLHLFGIPYITAPQEAEAQCAELLRLHLVDAIVTDDSDVLLFGGDNILRNVFSQARFAEIYKCNTILSELGFNREIFIQLAYLLGSDYTEGIDGIGPRIALEVIKAWPGNQMDGLKQFADCIRDPSMVKTATEAQAKLLKRLRNVLIDDEFPRSDVWNAYMHPSVDTSSQEFQWGQPDVERLRRYLTSTLGWDTQQLHGYLTPVLTKYCNTLASRRVEEEKRKRSPVLAPRQLKKRAVSDTSQLKQPAPRRKKTKLSNLKSIKDLYEKAAQRNPPVRRE